jgi:crossover junction endodeoxyribonuclease RuvC
MTGSENHLKEPMAMDGPSLASVSEHLPKIVGIDPGLRVTGYSILSVQSSGVVVHEAGVIRVNPQQPLANRLSELYDGIREVLATENVMEVALEQLFSHYKRPKTAILMGHARGVICLAAAQRGVKVTDYEPTRVKRLITGSGRASKEQIQAAVCREFRLAHPPEPHDVADAMAIALCHYHAMKGQRILDD